MSKKKPVDPHSLPYRPCVGIMVLNRDGLVWAGHRIVIPNDEMDGATQLWQMPQGGIDKGEDAESAALRELYEETGMKTVTLLAEAPNWINYDLASSSRWRCAQGQVSRSDTKMVRLSLRGQRKRNRNQSAARRPHAGIRPVGWKPMAQLPDLIVPFKRTVYEEVVAAFRHLAD